MIGVSNVSQHSRSVLFSITALILAFAIPSWADGPGLKTDVGASSSAEPLGGVSLSRAELARNIFKHATSEADHYMVDTSLKMIVLDSPPEHTQRIYDYMVANQWEPDFITLFTDNIRWYTGLTSAGAERVYEEGRKYAATKLTPIGPRIKAEDRYEPIFADILIRRADKMGSKKAALHFARKYLSDSSGIMVSIGQKTLWDIASEGILETRYEIATRYRDGNLFPEDKAMALFWFLMAREQGRNVDEEVAALSADLLPATVETIKTTIAEGWDLRLREDEKGRAYQLGLEKVDPLTTPEAIDSELRDAFASAYTDFIRDKSPGGRAAVKLRLRLKVAHNRPAATKQIFDDMVAKNNEPDFMRMFAEAIDWYEALKAGGAERLYEEAQKYGTVKSDIAPWVAENRDEPLVAGFLYEEAAKMGSEKASLAIVREFLSFKQGPYQSIGQDALWELAQEGSEGAGFEIATRFRDGNAFPHDPALALYWYLRAAEQGSDVRADITALTKELPPDAVRKIEENVAESHVPEFR